MEWFLVEISGDGTFTFNLRMDYVIYNPSFFIAALEYPEACFGDESAIPYATKYLAEASLKQAAGYFICY